MTRLLGQAAFVYHLLENWHVASIGRGIVRLCRPNFNLVVAGTTGTHTSEHTHTARDTLYISGIKLWLLNCLKAIEMLVHKHGIGFPGDPRYVDCTRRLPHEVTGVGTTLPGGLHFAI